MDDVHHRTGRDAGQADGFADRLGAEIQRGDLHTLASRQLVDHHQQPRRLHIGNHDLLARGDVVGPPHAEDALELAGEGAGVAQLLDQAAVERACLGQAFGGHVGLGREVGQVIGAAMQPAGVAVAHQVFDLCGLQGQGTDQVPAGEGEHARLHGVEHHQQDMQALDLLDLGRADGVQVADAQRGGNDAGGGAGHPVGDELEVVGRVFAGQPLVHFLADVLTQDAAGQRLAAVVVMVVGVQRPEVHQLQGQLVVVLQRMDQRGRVDTEGVHLAQHQPQELGVAGEQGVVIGRAGDEVVGQVGAAVGHGGDVIDGQVQLLEAETAGLADGTGDQLVAGDRQRVALGPGGALGAALDAEEAIGVQAQHARAGHVDGMQRIADDQLLGGEGRVQPVQRRLAFLEVVQVDPAAALAVHAGDDAGGAPVGVLDPRLEEDHALQLADDVVLLLELVDHHRRQVDCVASVRHVGQ